MYYETGKLRQKHNKEGLQNPKWKNKKEVNFVQKQSKGGVRKAKQSIYKQENYVRSK